MAKRNEFVEHVVETMRLFGPVEAKRMFGVVGLYHRGAIFALVGVDALYLKADDESRGAFEALDLEPFTFRMKGEEIVTSYYRAPDETLESPDVMLDWARRGYGAALRAAARKKRIPRKAVARKAKRN